MIIGFLFYSFLAMNAPLWRDVAISDTIIEIKESACVNKNNLGIVALKGSDFGVSCKASPGIYFYVTISGEVRQIKFVDWAEKNFPKYKMRLVNLIKQESRAINSFDSCVPESEIIENVKKSIAIFSKMEEQVESKVWIMKQDKSNILALISMISDKSKSFSYRSEGYVLDTPTKGEFISALLAWRFSGGGQISYLHMSPGIAGELNGIRGWKWFGWRICRGLEDNLFLKK
jgi:hypothetical protein